MSQSLYKLWGKNIKTFRQVKDAREGIENGRIVMAQHIGVTDATASRWEAGLIAPSDANRIEIGEYLQVPTEILFPLVRVVA